MPVIRAFLILFFAFFLVSCQKEEFQLEDLNGTWNMEWKRCELFHNQPEGKIEFTVNDSINDQGRITERIGDTLAFAVFKFQWVNNETLIIESLSDSTYLLDWIGSHRIYELSTSRFELEREKQSCEQERYKFVK